MFNRYRTLGLRTKVIAVILGMTVVLTLLATLLIQTIIYTALGRQLEEKAVSIAGDIAARSVNPLLTGNYYALHNLAHGTLNNYEDVRYVFFLDQHGNVVAHSFEDGFPGDLLEANRLAPGERFSLKKFRTAEGLLRDVAVPVFDTSIGELARVGLLERSLQNTLNSVKRHLLFIAALTSLAASAIAYLFTSVTTIRPLNSMLATVQAVTRGDLSRQVPIRTSDELGQLAHGFNIMTQRLAKTQSVRDRLLKKMINTQEDERRRIARELHDETGQSLMTLMIGLRVIEQSGSAEELKRKAADFRRLLLSSLENVRMLAWRLTPLPLEDLGLKAALESFCRKFADNQGWELALQIDENTEQTLSREQETALYRIVQESLTNIARHAGASSVGVMLKRLGPNKLIMIIEDDGKGFDVEETRRDAASQASLGLVSIEERVHMFDGELEIESRPDAGTTIYIKIPLPNKGGSAGEEEVS